MKHNTYSKILEYTNIEVKHHLYTRDLDVKNKSYIYGEVDPTVIVSILLKDDILQEGDRFLDIGSGCGKMIIHLANKNHFKNNYFTGIEIHQTRHETAISLLDQYDKYNNIEFIYGDYNTLNFRNYNVLYCCNTIFGDKENNELFNKILHEFSGYFILFEYDKKFTPYLINKYTVNTSWNKNVDIWLFRI